MDLKHILGAESYAVVLHLDVGVGSKEAKAGRKERNPCLFGSAYDAGDGNP